MRSGHDRHLATCIVGDSAISVFESPTDSDLCIIEESARGAQRVALASVPYGLLARGRRKTRAVVGRMPNEAIEIALQNVRGTVFVSFATREVWVVVCSVNARCEVHCINGDGDVAHVTHIDVYQTGADALVTLGSSGSAARPRE